MKNRILKNTLSALLFVLTFHAMAQGPELFWFYNSGTELSWASCHIRFQDGTIRKTGFFPVINEKTNCPMGLENYSKNIDIDAPLVFLNTNHPGNIGNLPNPALKDKVVMLSAYSDDTAKLPDQTGFLEEKIRYAIDNNAAGVVILLLNNSYPLYIVNTDKEIPAISITDKTVSAIFRKAGLDYNRIAKGIGNHKFSALTELPVRLKLQISGRFSSVETSNFTCKYLPNSFTRDEINRQMKINEQSVGFLLGLFKELDFKWSKENIWYFSNFDSKIFYTGYWGIGFSCDAGVYNVYFSNDSNYRLSVHENTHSLLRKNSLTFSSFFDEGIARYAEAMAANKNLNYRPTVEFLKTGKLFSLEEMLDFNIGNNPEETEVGYPAAGSFVEFLIEKYGLNVILRLSRQASNPFPVDALISHEKEWINWLKENFEPE